MHQKEIRARALWAKEWAQKHGNLGAEQDADAILSFLDSDAFDVREMLRMSAYQTVLRIWNR